jgi:hypothetical protein
VLLEIMALNVSCRNVCVALNNHLNAVTFNVHVVSCCFLTCVCVVFNLAPFHSCYYVHYLIHHFPNNVLIGLYEKSKMSIPKDPSTL